MTTRYVAVILLILFQLTSSQLRHGTVIYIERWKGDLITLAADSRSTTGDGKHSDDHCKLAAFGTDFVEVMGGYTESRFTNGSLEWNAHDVARETWKEESVHSHSADELVEKVTNRWTEKMKGIYKRPGILEEERRYLKGHNMLTTAVFAGTDKAGNMAGATVNIRFDLQAFDSSKTIRFVVDQSALPSEGWNSGGHDTVLRELRLAETKRGKKFAAELLPQLSRLPVNEQRSTLATKLIEQSVILETDQKDLGLPADVLQLQRTSGVVWVHRKSNCPSK